MENFKTIKQKLKGFINKYYTNELIKGVILFFAIGALYFLITLFVEYILWLDPSARTVLFWLFVLVEFALFVRFIAIPIAKLFKFRSGINLEEASRLIGNHFPEVNDKLLNVLQLNNSPKQSDLLLASIEQKSKELRPIPFQSAINFKTNIKYLKYALIPLCIVLMSWATGKIGWFSDSYERVVNYQTAYEPPAPFQFFVVNNKLQAIEGQEFRLKVKTAGDIVPSSAQIIHNGQTSYLQSMGNGEFQYVFSLPRTPIEFRLNANGVESRVYKLDVVSTPSIVNFEMFLDYPQYTKKTDQTLKSTGNAVVPEGTKITWVASTKTTDDVRIYANDTLQFVEEQVDLFKATKQVFQNYNYSISTSNSKLLDYENLAYKISTVKDTYPELSIKMQIDSTDNESLFFYGQATDDYSLTKLQLVYYPTNTEDAKEFKVIPINNSGFADFISVFPGDLILEDGQSYQLYFEVFDNDVLHNYKRTKSSVYGFRKLTQDEETNKKLEEQSNTIKNISKTFDKLQDQDKKLEELSKIQKEKEALSFNDKKKLEDFIKRQKEQEQLMKNFNKKLQKNLDEYQSDKKDQFKEDLKKRIKENEEQLKKDENLLKELEEYKDKINKEELAEKLEELAKQNKNKKRSMRQLLELTKRFYVMQKTGKMADELFKLSKKQEKLFKKAEENTSDAQEKLNQEFLKIQKDIEDLKREDRRLMKPTGVYRDEFLEEEIKYDQNEAKKALSKKEENGSKGNSASKENKQKAQQRQKQAAKKLKEISDKMRSASGGGGGEQIAEDADMLRQILENLLLFSFDQEDLMKQFEGISLDNNNYGKYIIKQSNLREHFEHVDDSLFALSLRQPKISERINAQITEVYFNIDKSLDLLTENRVYLGVASQQYAITAGNELASYLSNILDNMEMSMSQGQGQGEGQGFQLPDIIKSQEELRKELEEELKQGEKGGDKNEGESNKGEEKGKGEKEGEQGQEGEQGEQGNQGNQGEQGEQGQSGNEGRSGQEGDSGKEGQQGENGENGKQENGNNGQGINNSDSNQKGEGNSEQGEGTSGENENKTDASKEGKGGNGNNNNGDGSDGSGDGNEEDNTGYGEGGNEEQNAKLYKIYQRQQQLRQALEDKMVKDGTIQSAGQLIRQMEDLELDLLNYGITNQTLQKMMEVQHQLLKLENAALEQDEDKERESKTNTEEFNELNNQLLEKAKEYFNTTEILNRQALPLQNHLKQKIQEYFKTRND